jgi:hypothetical protein
MPAKLVRYASAVAVAAAFLGSVEAAHAVARTPSISGNGWVALGIIGVLVMAIVMLIRGALHLERRDATLGRRPNKLDDGWFGIFPASGPDEEDAPDFHYDDGGEGGEGSG